MWCDDSDDSENIPAISPYLRPVNGDPVRIGSDTEGLRVLFSNRAMWNYFKDRSATAGTFWNDQCRDLPLAWAGDAAKPIFWALVKTADLVSESEPTSSAPTGVDAHAGKPSDKIIPETQLTLLRLRHGVWDCLPGPDAAAAGQSFWLASREEKVCLFWQVRSQGIYCVQLVDGNWTPQESVTEDNKIIRGWAGYSKQGPVFVAGRGQSNQIKLHISLRDSEGWSKLGMARKGNDYLTIDPAVSGIGICRQRLVVARLTDDGHVEFGQADLGVSPLLRFSTLSKQLETTPPVAEWTEIVTIALVLGILTIVLYSRRDQVNLPAEVPKGFVIASVWRRVLAGFIDLAPAVIVMALYFGMIEETLDLSDDPAVLVEQLSDPDRFKKLLPMNLLFLLVYGLWCMAWELASGTTLGKRIFDCRVLGSNGLAPSARQLVVRNILRVVSLALGPPGWMMTMMLMLMFTRNRQRLGDLLANTIVVQPDVSSVHRQAHSGDRDDSPDNSG